MPAFRFYDIEVMREAFTVAMVDSPTRVCRLWLALPAGRGVPSERHGPLAGDLVRRRWATVGRDGAMHPEPALLGAIVRRVVAANPALPKNAKVLVHDLNTAHGLAHLALRLGLYSGRDIADPSNRDQTLDRFVDQVTDGGADPMPAEIEGQPLRLICDLDPGFSELRHPYIAGYNSLSYDLVVLALMFSQALWPTGQAGEAASFAPIDPALLRAFSSQLIAFDGFTPSLLRPVIPLSGHFPDGGGVDDFGKARDIFDQWTRSGRHLDVARLNEAQAFVGLKRLLSQMGHQVIEYAGLADGVLKTADDLVDLCAYNVADAFALTHLMGHPLYAGALELRRSLIDEHPSTVRDHLGRVRSFKTGSGARATVNSTSAQLVENILAPNQPITDFRGVSFLYPRDGIEVTHPATECGRLSCACEGRDELENAWRWFDSTLDGSAASDLARAQVKEVFDFYRSIRSQSFNGGGVWSNVYGADPDSPSRFSDLKTLPKARMTVPYFRADGEATDCFINFSIGGSHGAQHNAATLAERNAARTEFNIDLAAAMAAFPGPDGPLTFFAAKTFAGPSGRDYARQHLLTPASTRRAMTAALEAGSMGPDGRSLPDAPVPLGWREAKALAAPFADHGGANRLDPKLGFTSVGRVLHEDFSSYYPNLLSKLRVFDAGAGVDPYMDIYQRKEALGAVLKDPSTPPEQLVRASVLRGGNKLVLNSASGAADMERDTKIRANNAILSMRILGQIEIWRVAQAQAFAGAQIVSTNTDGLYVVGADALRGRLEAIVASESARIGIAIEPELLWLVSKDSNNRLELADDCGKPGRLLSAGGASLAAFKGPTPAKSLANPGLVDQLLAEAMAHYLESGPKPRADLLLPFDQPIDEVWLDRRLAQLFADCDPGALAHLARQCARVVVAGSAGTNLYPYAVDAATVSDAMDASSGEAELLGKYSRVFLVKEGTPGAKRVATACLRQVSPQLAARRAQSGLRPAAHHPRALNALTAAGVERLDLFEAAARLTTRLDSTQPVLIDERDLIRLAEVDPGRLRASLIDHLDPEAYKRLVLNAWELWRNQSHARPVKTSGPVVAPVPQTTLF
jgi:hypothetical protein